MCVSMINELLLSVSLYHCRRTPCSLSLLSSVEEYCDTLPCGDDPASLSNDCFTEFLAVLKSNLSSPISQVQ